MLVFRREAFLAGPTDPRTFHQRAIEEGRFYEERVAASLSALVFELVFPGLAHALAAAAPAAPLPKVRDVEATRFNELVEYTPFAVQFRYAPGDLSARPLDRDTAIERVEALLKEVRRQSDNMEDP